MSRSIRSYRDKQAPQKQKILAEIRRLCVSYAGFSLMMPDMFGYAPFVSRIILMIRDAPRETDLCSYLMQDMLTDVKLPEEFLNELAKRFHDDGLIDVIRSTVIGIAEEIALVKFNENYRSVAIRVLSSSLPPLIPGNDPPRSDKTNRSNNSRPTKLDPYPDNPFRSANRTIFHPRTLFLPFPLVTRSPFDILQRS